MKKNMRRAVAAALACVLIFNAAGAGVFAAGPAHEDPEVAKLVYNSLALLRYYAETLEYVLSKNADEVNLRFGTMPFANVPDDLKEPTAGFSSADMNIVGMVVSIDKDLTELRLLLEQKRFDKAIEVTVRAHLSLAQAYKELEKLELSAEATGEELKIDSLPPGSQLRVAYNEVLADIQRIKAMLDLDLSLLSASVINFQLAGEAIPEEEIPALLQQLENSTREIKGEGITERARTLASQLEQLIKNLKGNALSTSLHPTAVTLKIDPEIAFVGDNIHFEGFLSSEGMPLSEQTVEIILSGAPFTSAVTGNDGRFAGALEVPYRYINEMGLQAIYYPRDKEAGLYIPSLSPVVKLSVLFYEATLEIAPEKKAYPGRDTTVTGKFDYAGNPPVDRRNIEIYLDGAYITGDEVEQTFSEKIRLAPETETGGHTLVVSAAAEKRYAPVFASAALSVMRVIPNLDLDVPGIAVIPGSVDIKGRLYSDISPVSGARVETGLDRSRAEFATSDNGTFDARLTMSMGFGIIGSQDLKMTVIPREPWHDTLVFTRKVLVINLINVGVILAILVFLGVYLPAKLKKKPEVYPEQGAGIEMTVIQPQPALKSADGTLSVIPAAGTSEIPVEPRKGILNWYRLAINVVQRIANAVLKPNQTLREFAGETGAFLGPAAGYFAEFTRIVERLIYSPYVATTGDVEAGRRLSNKIGIESGVNHVAQPATSRNKIISEPEASAESSENPASVTVSGALSVGRKRVSGNVKQLPTRLLVALAAAIIWYVLLAVLVGGWRR